MADMLELIARLEAVEVGSAELDEAVAVACGSKTQGWAETASDGTFLGSIRPYSVSLDAALALAERLWAHVMWRVGHDPDDGSLKAELVTAQKPGDPPAVTANAATPALALCIAILKAIHHARTSTAGYEAAGVVSPNLKAKAQGEGG